MIKPILLTLGLAVMGANAFAATSTVQIQDAPAPVAAGFTSSHAVDNTLAGIKDDASMAERLS